MDLILLISTHTASYTKTWNNHGVTTDGHTIHAKWTYPARFIIEDVTQSRMYAKSRGLAK